jgi:hypothetical protein
LGTSACDIASPVRGLDFKAPSGWATDKGTGFAQTWYTPRPGRSDTDLLIVSRSSESDRNRPDTGDEVASNERQITRRPITICGNHPAWYRETRRQSVATEEIVESIATSWAGIVYRALYIRLSDEPRNPDAEAAMRSLCQRNTS